MSCNESSVIFISPANEVNVREKGQKIMNFIFKHTEKSCPQKSYQTKLAVITVIYSRHEGSDTNYSSK